MQYFSIYDFVLAPIYLGVLYFITLHSFFRIITDPTERFFFKYGILTKIFGSLTALSIYFFYYKGGDTIQYYSMATILFEFLSDSPEYLFDVLMLKDLRDFSPYAFLKYKYLCNYFFNENTYMVGKIGFIFYLLSMGSIVCTYILSAFFSFFTSWKFYNIFIDNFPSLKRPIGYAIFFMPSAIFWGSGLFKDTFTLGGLYLFLYASIEILIKRKITIVNFFYFILGAFLMLSIRSFFLISLLPFIFIWIFFHYYNSVRNKKFKWIFFPFFLVVVLILGAVVLQVVNDYLIGMNIESFENKLAGFQSWHSSLGGSAYTLGDFEYNLAGYSKVFFKAIVVTFFRPFPWEASKAIIMLSSIQSLFFIYFTLRVLLKTKIYYFFKILFREHIVFSLMGFSLFFGYITGITSYNFGALDRYKIPCLSTYIIAIILIQYYYKKDKNLY